MTTEHNETILDGCLEEVLGGAAPPDLTARIIKAYSESESHILNTSLEEVLGDVTPPDVAAQVIELHQQQTPSARVTSASRRSMSSTQWVAIAITLVLVAFGLTIGGRFLVDQPESPSVAHEEDVFEPAPSLPEPDQIAKGPIDPLSPTPMAPLPGPVEIPVPTIRHPLQLKRPAPGSMPTPAGLASVGQQREVLDDQQVVQSINNLIRSRWQEAGASPAAKVGDGPWCERVYERVLGRQPTESELASFVADQSPDRRAELLELLMSDEGNLDEFAHHWGEMWTDVLLASSDRRVDRDGLAKFLGRSFADGRSIAQIAADLITATGSTRSDGSTSANYNGAATYLAAYADPQRTRPKLADGGHVLASAHVSRTFLGISMECNQCHNASSWRGYKQQSFWEFNAFFRQMTVDQSGALANVDFPGEGSTPDEAEIYFEMTSGRLLSAYPVFVDQTTDGFDRVPRSGFVDSVDRRQELAKLIVRSRFFQQAMVNRFWGEMFGAGFTTPVDDLGPHNPASHPKLLAQLGDQFAAHDYDVRKLVKWIALSEPFGLAAETESSERQIGTQELFASFPVVVPTDKSLQESLALVVQLHNEHSKFGGGFETTARVAPVSPGTAVTEIANAEMMPAVTRYEVHEASDSLFAEIILGSKLSTNQKIQHMFFATVHRPPTKRERATIDKLIAEPETDAEPLSPHAVNDALRYIWWALSNSRDAR